MYMYPSENWSSKISAFTVESNLHVHMYMFGMLACTS